MGRVINAARRLRRRFLPAHMRSDVRDMELLVALMEEVVGPDSDCLDVGAHAGSVLAELVRLAPEGRHVASEPLPEFGSGCGRRIRASRSARPRSRSSSRQSCLTHPCGG
jgi:hypothetical protein